MSTKHRVTLLLFYLAFLVVVVFTLYDVSRVSLEPIWDTDHQTLAGGWTLSVDGEIRYSDLTIPTVLTDDDLYGKQMVLSRSIPAHLDRPYSIMVRTSQKAVDILLDGELLYHYDGAIDERRIRVYGYINHVAWLPDDPAGKLLEIRTVTNDARSGSLVYDVFIGSRAAQIIALLRYDGLSLLFGSVILFIALIVFILALSTFKSNRVQAHAFSLAGIEFCAGLWMVSNSMSTQLLFHNQLIMLVGGVIAMFLLPVFITRFVTGMYALKESRIFSRVVLVFPLWFIVISVLQLAGLTVYRTWFLPGASVLLIYFLVLVAFCIKAYIQGNRLVGQFIIAFACLLGAVIGELILLVLPVPSLLNALFLSLGIFAFSTVLLRQVLTRIMEQMQRIGREEYLLSLAHTDGLTRVANRQAFEERLSAMRDQMISYPVACMVVDVNNLKKLNDQEGHTAGDAILCALAQRLSNIFAGIATVYRIGGDEFVVISEGCDCTRYEQARGRVMQLDQEDLDFAWGDVVWMNRSDGVSIDVLFAQSDEAMYQQKLLMKQGLAR
jgi:diguanylate cyclase (GGDEF)-like protein